MNVVRGLENLKTEKYSVATIGTFDGVHLGHRELLDFVASRTKEYGGDSILITFDPHPRMVLHDRGSFSLITSLEEKVKLINESEIDTLLILPFTKEFSQTTGRQFIEEIMIKRLKVDEVVVGYDHAFGHQRSGNIELLQQYANKKVFELKVFEPHHIHSKPVKSSLIRKCLLEGDVDTANLLLGRGYEITGKVIKGLGRGRRLNFPTANLELTVANKLVPGKGIYIAKVLYQNSWYPAAVSIGIRPTFNEHEITIEAYIIEFNSDLYGEEITVHFLQRIRDELKFNSENELIQQMHLDVAEAKEYFNQSEMFMEE